MAALRTTTLYFAAGIEAAGVIVNGLAAIEVLILALVIFIPYRTALNYLLQMAIDKFESRRNSPAVSAFRKA